MVYRILGTLVGDIPGSKWHEAALKLVHPLLPVINRELELEDGHHIIMRRLPPVQWYLKFCFHLLEGNIAAMGEDQVRSVAILLRCLARYPFKFPTEHTQGQADLLVDYHIQNCQGTDHEAIGNTFEVMARVGASPSTQGRMRRYIETLIQYIEITPKALHAAWTVRSAITSLGQEDKSFRERFSKALSSVLLGYDSSTHQLPDDTTPPKMATNIITRPNITSLRFLCLLFQLPAWHPQLHHNSYFDYCLALADALSSGKHNDTFSDQLAVPVAHILAMMDALGEESPFFKAVQDYPNWPVIRRAWRYIFGPKLKIFWDELSTTECIAAIPPLVASARRRCGNDEEPVIIALVEQAFHKLNQERQNHEQDGSQKGAMSGESDDLNKEICRLLNAMPVASICHVVQWPFSFCCRFYSHVV